MTILMLLLEICSKSKTKEGKTRTLSGCPSYNLTLLSHSCTLWGFCLSRTLFSSKGRRSIKCSNLQECNLSTLRYSHSNSTQENLGNVTETGVPGQAYFDLQIVFLGWSVGPLGHLVHFGSRRSLFKLCIRVKYLQQNNCILTSHMLTGNTVARKKI